MDTILLAKFMGIFSIVAGISMIMKRRMLLAVFSEIAEHRAILYIIGILEIIAGLIIVLNHSEWSGILSSVISILGWILLLEGATYMFVSKRTAEEIFDWMHQKNIYSIVAGLYLVLGVYLTYAGFFG